MIPALDRACQKSWIVVVPATDLFPAASMAITVTVFEPETP